MKNKKLFLATLIGFASLTFLSGCGGSNDGNINYNLWDKNQNSLRKGNKNFAFYGINDFHGATEFSSDTYEPGINKLSTYIKNQREYNQGNMFLFSSGDMWQGSADSNITRGELVVSWMNILDFDAQAVGNHEFDWTTDVIKDNLSKMEFPLLACNIVYKTNNENVEWAKPYTTITRNGLRVGVVGAIGEGQEKDILSENVKEVKFLKPEQEVNKWSKYLKDNGADIVVYLKHDSITSITETEAKYVDLIFGGHTHTGENNFDTNNVTQTDYNIPALQAWSNGKDLGHIDLNFNFKTKKNTIQKVEIVDTRSFKLNYYVDDVETKLMYQSYLDNKINAIKNVVVLKNSTGIERDLIPYIYNQYAYKYFKDCIDLENKYEILAVETNGARSLLPAGDITFGDIYKALPFDNHLNLVKIKGVDVYKLGDYSSSYFFMPSANKNYRSYNFRPTVVSQQYYYVLMIDFIAQKHPYSQYVEVVESYNDEPALPREIMRRYLGQYPTNYIA